MYKINLFQTKIFVENKVYVLVSDAAKAFGFENIKEFEDKYPDIIKIFEELPKLVLESDFNMLLSRDKEILKRLGHIEMTRVETLRSKTEIIKSLYPIKYMIAKSMFEEEAAKSNCGSIEEYIEKVDFVNEIKKAEAELIGKPELLDVYNECKKRLAELIDYNVLRKYGLELQQYIHINDGKPHLESFIVGKGIFFSVFDSDYAFDMLRVDNDDLIVPAIDDYEMDFEEKNFGHDLSMRDYREYGTLENLLYLIQSKNVEDVGVDLMCCQAPGVYFYISQKEIIKLLNPNMYREIILIDGCVDFENVKVITSEG